MNSPLHVCMLSSFTADRNSILVIFETVRSMLCARRNRWESHAKSTNKKVQGRFYNVLIFGKLRTSRVSSELIYLIHIGSISSVNLFSFLCLVIANLQVNFSTNARDEPKQSEICMNKLFIKCAKTITEDDLTADFQVILKHTVTM